MGNQRSQAYQSWQVILNTPGMQLRSSESGEVLQFYNLLYTNEQEMELDLQKISLRKIQKLQNVVEVRDFFKFQEKKVCSTSFKTLLVMERISNKLSMVRNLQEQRALVSLYQAVRGFKNLAQFNQTTGFQILADMVGFNQADSVKVWWNSQFQQLNPQVPIKARSLYQQQQHILQLIEHFRIALVQQEYSPFFQRRLAQVERPLRYLKFMAFIEEFVQTQFPLTDRPQNPTVNKSYSLDEKFQAKMDQLLGRFEQKGRLSVSSYETNQLPSFFQREAYPSQSRKLSLYPLNLVPLATSELITRKVVKTG